MFIENILGKKSSVRLLRILSMNPNKWFFQKELSELSGLGMGVTSDTLEELVKYGVIERDERGRMIFFRFKKEGSLSRGINELFVCENTLLPMFSYTTKATLSEYISKIQMLQKENLEFIVVYGSTVRGTAGKHSDIDLLLVLERKTMEREVKEISSELSERFGVDISPMILSVDELKQLAEKREPLIRNIRDESVILYGSEKDFRNIITK